MPITYKIVLVGDPEAGKTQLLKRYTKGDFNDQYEETVGVEVGFKTTFNSLFKYSIYDIAGAKRFESFAFKHLSDARVVLICVDLSKKEPLENINALHELVKGKVYEDCLIYLVGTKSDIDVQDKITKQEIREKAKELGYKGHVITNAKNGENIQYFFDEQLANDINKHYQNNAYKPNNSKDIKDNFEEIYDPEDEENLVFILAGWLKRTIKNHPYGITFGILLALGVIAIFFIPGVGQALGLTALTKILIAETATHLGLSVMTAKVVITTGLSMAALTASQWLGRGLKNIAYPIKKIGEALLLPGYIWIDRFDKIIPDDKYPLLNKIISKGFGIFLIVITASPLFYLIGKLIEIIGKQLAGIKQFDNKKLWSVFDYGRLENYEFVWDKKFHGITLITMSATQLDIQQTYTTILPELTNLPVGESHSSEDEEAISSSNVKEIISWPEQGENETPDASPDRERKNSIPDIGDGQSKVENQIQLNPCEVSSYVP